MLDPEDDDDVLLLQHNSLCPRKSTQFWAFKAGDADEDEPEGSHALKPKKANTKAAADLKQTKLEVHFLEVTRVITLAPHEVHPYHSSERSK